jgi:phage protein D
MGEMSLTALGLYTPRPTLRIGGQERPRADQLLQAMVMREAEGGMSSLELGFSNWASNEQGGASFAFEDEQIFKLGAELKVYAGEVAGPTEIFSGKVSALETSFDSDGPPRLTLYAEDALAKARLARRIEVYENKSVADVAREICGRVGLTPTISGLSDSTGTWVQLNETDLAFLRRLLARHGADMQVVAGELQVAPRAEVRRNEVELRLHSQLYRVRAVADLAQQVTEVRVTSFDAEQGQAVEGTGSGAALGPGSGRKGADLVRQAFGERTEQVSHRFANTQAEARALAEAEFAARARSFVRVEGVAEGNPGLRVGSHVKLIDVSPRFDNTYYVTACTHRFDMKRGFESEFVAESAFFGEAA